MARDSRDDDGLAAETRRALRDLQRRHARGEPDVVGDLIHAIMGILQFGDGLRDSQRRLEEATQRIDDNLRTLSEHIGKDIGELRSQQQENITILYGGRGTPLGLAYRVGLLEERLTGKPAAPAADGKLVQLIGAAVVVGGTVLIGIIAKWLGISVSVPGG